MLVALEVQLSQSDNSNYCKITIVVKAISKTALSIK